MITLIIHTDASCGDSVVGIGYTIRVGDRTYEGSSHFEGHYTSMEAEYLALREAARIASQFFNVKEHTYFYTDCDSLVKKMESPNGSEKWNERRDSLLSILSQMKPWSLKWVPRERNSDADALAHTAKDSAL